MKYAEIYPRYSFGNSREVEFDRLVHIGKTGFINWNPPAVQNQQDDDSETESIIVKILEGIVKFIFGMIEAIFTIIFLIVKLFFKFIFSVIRIGIIRW